MRRSSPDSIHAATGLYERFRLADSLTTLAERLSAIGYETDGLSCNPWLNRQNGMAQGFDVYEEVYRLTEDEREKGGGSQRIR